MIAMNHCCDSPEDLAITVDALYQSLTCAELRATDDASISLESSLMVRLSPWTVVHTNNSHHPWPTSKGRASTPQKLIVAELVRSESCRCRRFLRIKIDANGLREYISVDDVSALESSRTHSDTLEDVSSKVDVDSSEIRTRRFLGSLVDLVIILSGSTETWEADLSGATSDTLTLDAKRKGANPLRMKDAAPKGDLRSNTFARENLLQLRQRRIELWNAVSAAFGCRFFQSKIQDQELDRISRNFDTVDIIPVELEREFVTIQKMLLGLMKEHLHLYRQYVGLCRREVAVEMIRARGLDNQRARGRNTL